MNELLESKTRLTAMLQQLTGHLLTVNEGMLEDKPARRRILKAFHRLERLKIQGDKITDDYAIAAAMRLPVETMWHGARLKIHRMREFWTLRRYRFEFRRYARLMLHMRRDIREYLDLYGDTLRKFPDAKLPRKDTIEETLEWTDLWIRHLGLDGVEHENR